MKKIKLGYIGSGPVSIDHIKVLKNTGFKITVFFSRNFSKALEFSTKNKIAKPEKYFKNFLDKKNDVDAFILAVKTNASIKYLQKLCLLNKPIFVEKPGALLSRDLKKIQAMTNSKIFILYNRRFYKSINEGKKFISNSKYCFASIKIPDSVKSIEQFITNSSHVIDLLFYYFKDIKLIKSIKLKKKIGFYFLLKSKSDYIISCLLNWGSPQNYEINLYNEKNQRLEIKPLEISMFYQNMDQIEPSKNWPIRSYIPKLKKKILSVHSNIKYKAGFVEQYKEIKKILKYKNFKYNICDLEGGIKVLELIEKIIKLKY